MEEIRDEEIMDCLKELRKTQTISDIKKALAEYAGIVRHAAEEYTDKATVEDIRADHPELNFMDDDEIVEMLSQAKTLRNK